LNLDLEYIHNVSFLNDLRLILETFQKAIVKREGITDGENATALDYGDELLESGKIDRNEYNHLQEYAKKILLNTKLQ
jgi:hypothetical protein